MGTPLKVTVSFPLAASKIHSSLILGNVIMALVCASLGPASLGLSEVPGLPGSLFLSPDWGSSSLFVQISFQLLALPLRLLAPL